jgi:hypothetical protein
MDGAQPRKRRTALCGKIYARLMMHNSTSIGSGQTQAGNLLSKRGLCPSSAFLLGLEYPIAQRNKGQYVTRSPAL